MNDSNADPAGSAGRSTGPELGGAGGSAGSATRAGSGGAGSDAGSAGAASAGGSSATAGASGSAGAGNAALCVPSGVERCDGVDNDCNAVSDDGCPQGLSTVFDVDLALIGDSPGGTSFSDDCASGEILIGVQGTMDAFLTQIQGLCGKVGFSLRADPTAGYDVVLGAGTALSAHPETSADNVGTLKCPANEALVGVGVSQQILDSGADDYASALGSMADDSAWYAYSDVPVGQVATRLNGASGAWIDRLGFGVSNTSVALVR
jgi:hypothetical protein